MPTETCKSCKFYDPLPADGRDAGYCRKNPPSIIVMDGFESDTGKRVAKQSTEFPLIYEDEWCGCYEPQSVAALHANLTPLEHECLEIIYSIYDDDDCLIDTAGFCTVHWCNMDSDEECPHARAKALLKRCGIIRQKEEAQ